MTNPFMPGSDTVPLVWAGRHSHVNEWHSVIRPKRASGLYERGRTILGEAGLGKSSLVRRIAHQAAQSGDWATPQIRIPLGADPLRATAAALLKLADQAGLSNAFDQRFGALMNRVRTLAVAGASITLDRAEGPEPYAALRDLLIEIGKEAIDREVVALIHVDEVQNITDPDALSQLLVCFGDALAHELDVVAPGGVALTRHLPIMVYLTGLPEFADIAGARKGATFARRFQTSTLEPLTDDDLRSALHPFVTPGWEVAQGERVFVEQDACEAIIDLCCGEPFLFQLAGERAWYAGDQAIITTADVFAGWQSAKQEATAHVERILERLPRKERAFVKAMAALPAEERTATKIAQAIGFTSATQTGTTSQRLDTIRGVINRGRPHYSFRHRALEAYLTTDWPDITRP